MIVARKLEQVEFVRVVHMLEQRADCFLIVRTKQADNAQLILIDVVFLPLVPRFFLLLIIRIGERWHRVFKVFGQHLEPSLAELLQNANVEAN